MGFSFVFCQHVILFMSTHALFVITPQILMCWNNSPTLQSFASISSGFGEITFLAMTSHYHEFVTLVNFPTLFSYTRNTVAAWSSGTGGAGVFGALSYLALTSWFRLTPFATLNVITVLPFLILFSVFVLMSGNHAPRGRFCSLTVHNEKTGEDGNGSLTFRERVRQLVVSSVVIIEIL